MSKKKAKSLGYTAKQKRDYAASSSAASSNAASAPCKEKSLSTKTIDDEPVGTTNETPNDMPKAEKSAEENACLNEKAERELNERVCELYRSELKRLYLFAARWQAALPIDDRSPESARRKATVSAIKEIVSDNETINTAEQGREIVARISDLLASGGPKAPSDSFDLNEVLNPGELDLESLCKELGVMD